MKQKDYSEIEEKLSRKAEKLEADINYSGAMRDSKTKEGIKREKKEKRSFDFPGRQLVAAALAMVIVGAGTFGALKFLEYKGAQRIAEQGSADTSDGEKLAEADVSEVNPEKDLAIEPVEYDTRNDYGSGYVYVTSGDKVYIPFVCSESRMAVINYEPPKFAYSGKLNIVNNVKNRDWTVLNADFWFAGIESYDRTFDGMSLDQICDYIDDYSREWYRVYLKVTWDDPDDENAVIYYVDFVIKRAVVSDKFEDVVRFDIDYTDNKDAHKLALPLDHTYSNVQEVKCEAAEALGYSIYWYNSAALEYNSIDTCVCILDENDELVFDYQMEEYSNTILPEIWYARQTPSDHPMMFFLTSQLISSNGWVYSNLYAFDVTTKEEYLVISVGPEPHHSQSNLQVHGALSYENERIIVHYYDDLPRNIMNPYDKETWPDDPFAELPIKWNGSKYVVEGIDPARYPMENSGADTGTDVYVDPVTDTQDHSAWPYDPSGWMLVKSGSNQCAPAVTGYYKGSVRESYNIDIPVLEYDENSTIEILNNVRTTWHLADVGIDGKPIQNLANFGEYLKTLPINPENDAYLNFVIYAHWDAAEDNTDSGIFEFSFKLLIKGTPGKQIAENVTPKTEEKVIVSYANTTAVAPLKYAEWTGEQIETGDVKYFDINETIPVIDLDTAEGGAVKYDFDGELVRLEMTDISGYTFAPDEDGEMMSYMRTSASMDRSTSLVYVKVIFKRNEVKDRYVSFIYAVSTGTPRCYPYTNEGDGYAALWVADSRGIYAPKCELVVYNGYEPDDTDPRKFSSFMKSYYQMPYAKLDANFFIQMNDGYKLCYVVAFPELNSSMREVYKGNVGEELYTWLRTLPWSDYYAAIVVESTVGKLQLGNANQYHDMAYVVKLHSDGELPGANAAKIDHTAQIAELQGWFSGKMWSGMNEEELLNMATGEKDLKKAIMAAAYDQINREDDGTFVRHKTEHCDFLYFAEKDTRIIREARMILHPGTNFALPFGITLDMSPEEALSAMGYTETEIQDLKGANVIRGSFSLRYDGEFLVIQFTDNGAALGIEIGHGANAYIEMG